MQPIGHGTSIPSAKL